VAVSPVALAGPHAPADSRAPRLSRKGKAPAVPQAFPALSPRPRPALPVVTVRPLDIPVPPPAVPTSWSSVAKASGGEKSFTVVKRRNCGQSSPPPLKYTGGERHVVVRFEKRGLKARLATGVNTERVKNTLNGVLARGGGARFGSCVQH